MPRRCWADFFPPRVQGALIMKTRTSRNVFELFAVGLVCTFAVPRTGEAKVVAFMVEQRRSFANGMSWGSAGPYERLDGTAYFEVNPRDPLNAGIVNLDMAPKNARGLVEFSSTFFILKPLNMARGNHKLFYGINNRGNKIEQSQRAFPVPAANSNDPLTAADVGDGFLLRLGYAIVDAGWQGDVAPGNSRLFPKFPVASQPDGSPIVARLRIEYSDGNIQLDLGGERRVRLLRGRRHQSGAFDPDGPQRSRRGEGADRLERLGLREVPDR